MGLYMESSTCSSSGLSKWSTFMHSWSACELGWYGQLTKQHLTRSWVSPSACIYGIKWLELWNKPAPSYCKIASALWHEIGLLPINTLSYHY